MHFFREMEWTPLNIAKAAALALIAILFASFVYSFVATSLDRHGFGMGGGNVGSSAPHGAYYDEDYSEMSYDEKMADSYYGYDGGGDMGVGLSARNVMSMPASPSMPPMPNGGYTSGNTAEEFEVTEYSVSYETQEKGSTCAQLANLKTYPYVIFESANDHDRGCDYRFKVEHSRVSEILALLKNLNPKDLNENTYTIKNLVDDFSSETDVLENKRRAIDTTLEEAIAAYDEITALATANQDAESLARIIDSKIQLIERLTQQKIEINTQLDRLARAKAEQLDRLAYTYFNVSAYENKYVDKEHIADSWKESVRQMIYDVNRALQATTVGLVSLAFVGLQWIIYALIALFVATHLLSLVRRIWKGKPGSAPAPRVSRKKIGSDGNA